MQVGFWGLYFYCYSAKNMILHSFWENMPHCWIDKCEKLKKQAYRT